MSSPPSPTRSPRRPARSAPGLRVGPAAVAVGRGRSALAQWLRRPLTSLHLILGVFGLLTLFGLVMVLSASAAESYAADGSTYSVFVRQLMFCAAGLVLFWVGLRIPPARLRTFAAPILLIGIVALVAVLLPGVGELRGGSRGWFAIGPFTLQPSGVGGEGRGYPTGVRRCWPLRRALVHSGDAMLPVVPVALLICMLLVLQPDLGTAVAMGIVLVALLFFGGAPLWLLAASAAG